MTKRESIVERIMCNREIKKRKIDMKKGTDTEKKIDRAI